MTHPSVADLLERYKIACDLKQTVDRVKIEAAIKQWANKTGMPKNISIQFVSSARAAGDAWDAGAAGAAGAARAAGDAWDAGAAGAAWAAGVARAARVARAAGVAGVARVACWDVPWACLIAIGAADLKDKATFQVWMPLLEAFEAGAFSVWIGKDTLYVAVIPSILNFDGERRLHCENTPAFAWLDDIRDFYWHGVNVPEAWIMDRKSLTAKIALSEQNIERRRAACEIIGWNNILQELGGKTIDSDGDPQIGKLIEVKLPGEGKEKITARYLQVQCGTGRMFAVCIPPDTATALDAQAWMLGLPKTEFVRPEIRT